MPTFNVRRAEPTDLEQLISFTAQEFREAERNNEVPDTIREGIRAALEDNSLGMYWVLVNEDSRIIGNISVVKEWSNWLAGYYWWIQSLYIRPEFRGKGLIEKLLNAVKAAACDAEALELRLYVHKMNARAIAAYRKSGFSDADYQIMRLELGS